MTSPSIPNTTTSHRAEILSIMNALLSSGDYSQQVSVSSGDTYGGVCRSDFDQGGQCLALNDARAIHRELTAALAPASDY